MPPTANRIVAVTEPEESTAENPGALSDSAASAAAFNAWLPLVVTVVFMPVLAYLMTTLVLVPRLQKGLGAVPATSAASAAAKSGQAPKRESVMMSKLLVNVSGTMGSRYLLVSLSVVGNDPEFKLKVQEYEPQLRDMACSALEAKTLADLERPGSRNLIRSELLSGFNNILGNNSVQEIYFTEFAIQ